MVVLEARNRSLWRHLGEAYVKGLSAGIMMIYLEVVVSPEVLAGRQLGGVELVGLRARVAGAPVEHVALQVARAYRRTVHYDVPHRDLTQFRYFFFCEDAVNE